MPAFRLETKDDQYCWPFSKKKKKEKKTFQRHTINKTQIKHLPYIHTKQFATHKTLWLVNILALSFPFSAKIHKWQITWFCCFFRIRMYLCYRFRIITSSSIFVICDCMWRILKKKHTNSFIPFRFIHGIVCRFIFFFCVRWAIQIVLCWNVDNYWMSSIRL